VVEEMLPWLREHYGNPSSAYGLGKLALQAIEVARERIAALLGCEPAELIFTSCGSESINTAIQSALAVDPDRTHLVTSAVEHSATMKLGEHLARRGHEVTWLPVDASGQLDLERLEKSIRPDTALVSLLWANNETGVLFPVERVAEICRAKKVLFHCDAVQAVGKIPLNLADAGIHFLSVSGHKLHCPKGVGVLYVNRRVRFTPWLRGSQEGARRGGTQNVASIVALGKAAEIAAQHMAEEQTRVRALRDRFEAEILARVPGVAVNGDRAHRLPNTTNLQWAARTSAPAPACGSPSAASTPRPTSTPPWKLSRPSSRNSAR
jgi:cysteine desulfurase